MTGQHLNTQYCEPEVWRGELYISLSQHLYLIHLHVLEILCPRPPQNPAASHHLPCYCPGPSHHLLTPELLTVAAELVHPHLLWSASHAFSVLLLSWYFQSFVTFTESFLLFLRSLWAHRPYSPALSPCHVVIHCILIPVTPHQSPLSSRSPARCLCICLLLCLECFAFHSLHPLSLPRDCPP